LDETRPDIFLNTPFLFKGDTENFWGIGGANVGHTWIFHNVPHYQRFHFAASLFLQVSEEIGFGWHFSGEYYMK